MSHYQNNPALDNLTLGKKRHIMINMTQAYSKPFRAA